MTQHHGRVEKMRVGIPALFTVEVDYYKDLVHERKGSPDTVSRLTQTREYTVDVLGITSWDHELLAVKEGVK